MRFAKILIASAFVAGLATPVLAQPKGGLGLMSQVREERDASFKDADMNGDGKLDLAEFTASLSAGAVGHADGGMPTKAAFENMFKGRDENHDGFIDVTENVRIPNSRAACANSGVRRPGDPCYGVNGGPGGGAAGAGRRGYAPGTNPAAVPRAGRGAVFGGRN